jgi:hypothetical protein
MSIERCPLCGEFLYWGRACNCKRYTIEREGESSTYYGFSFDDVVEKYTKDYNEYDTPVTNGDAVFEEPLIVTDEDGVTKKFLCYAELSIEYFTKEVV